MNKSIAYLDVTDWGPWGGEHFAGLLRWRVGKRSFRHQLTHPLSAAEAIQINKKDGSATYKPGSISMRYSTEDDLIADAIAFCVEHKAIGLLLHGDEIYLDPQPVLYCDDSNLKRVLQSLVEKYKRKPHAKIEKQWKQALQKL